MKVKADQFQMTVSKMLNNEYYPQVQRVVSEVVPKVAKDAAKKLKSESPVGSGKNSGEYAKKWTSKAEEGRVNIKATVYGNAPTYRLAHLLEYGHMKRNGHGRTRAIVHIEPVEQWAVEEVQKRIAEKVGAV